MEFVLEFLSAQVGTIVKALLCVIRIIALLFRIPGERRDGILGGNLGNLEAC